MPNPARRRPTYREFMAERPPPLDRVERLLTWLAWAWQRLRRPR